MNLIGNTSLNPVLYGPSSIVTKQKHKPDPVYKHLPSESFLQGHEVKYAWPGTSSYDVIISEESDLDRKPPSPSQACSSRSPQTNARNHRMASMEMIREAHRQLKTQISEQNRKCEPSPIASIQMHPS